MRSSLKRGYIAAIVMVVAVAFLVVSMLSPVVSTTTDFSIFNSGWNGTSGLAISTYRLGKFTPSFQARTTGTDITIAQMNLNELSLGPNTTALAIIGPSKVFSSSDGALVGDFVRRGGMLVMADDFGTGNTLLERMGAGSRFSGKLAIDLSFEKKPEFSVCFDLIQDPLTVNVTSLLLNYPSTIVKNGTALDVLGSTSVASWLDTNGNRVQDLGEPQGPFPVIARERLGLGSILLLSDPSVLINGMRNYLDDAVFADNLVTLMCTGRSAVYFDESHRNFLDPVSVTTRFTGQVSTNAKVVLVAAAFVLALWVSTDIVEKAGSRTARRASWLWSVSIGRLLSIRGKEPSPDTKAPEEVIDEVSAAHPAWRPGLIKYAVTERIRHADSIKKKA
jgi:hypothetical protein